jgi:hypothetical protein
VFLWFAAIGGLTVVMSGGIARRAKVRPVPTAAAVPEPEMGPEPEPEPDLEPDLEPQAPVPDVEDEEVVAEIFAEIVVDEPEEPQPVFDDFVDRPATPRSAPRDLFDLDDDPEAHFFVDDDRTSDEPRRPSD